MRKRTCRICGQELFPNPLLELEGMPAAAQNLPTLETLPLDKRITLELRQCSCCGVVQLTNVPVSYFREVIRAAGVSPEMKEFRLKQFSKWIHDYDLTNGRILEVGCGGGEYLELMRQAGGDAYGVEYGDSAVAECRGKGQKVEKLYFEKGNETVASGPFDGFFILNWLEHIPNFRLFLKALRKNLSDNAVGLVEVPNFSMMLQKGQVAEVTSEHLYYFTEETFATTLENSGFEVVSCHPIWHDYILSAEVRKRAPVDNTLFVKRKSAICKEILEYVAAYRNVAIWGAGHQALAIMAMAGLEGKVPYVIDSSPVKQNKYTYATHIPIRPPETLKSDPVDAVLVMCAGYSDEVARSIRTNYPMVKHIAILREDSLERL